MQCTLEYHVGRISDRGPEYYAISSRGLKLTKDEYTRKMWRFYLRLEDEFCNTMTYVEFSENNMKTYSKEYCKILLSIGAEVDIICKRLCQQVCPEKKCNNITQYAEILCDYNDLSSASAKFSYSKEDVIPFNGWIPDNSPSWWKAYNLIKHDRAAEENEKFGNLENAFQALSGLFVLNRYYDDIVRAAKYGNFGYAASNFRASTGVIVVDKDDSDCKFTLTAHWSNGGTVSVDYSSYAAFVDFDKNNWSTSTTMSVLPLEEGITVVTFSNDVDSNSFQVLIIVTD